MESSFMPKEFGAWLTVNRDCNLRCSWCYAHPSRFDAKNSVMPLEIVEASICLFRDLHVKRVILIGGEPTVHHDFLVIVKRLKDFGIEPSLITNGIKLCNQGFLEKTIEAGISGITLSLKGGSPASYKKLTGVDRYSQAVRAISVVADSGINYSVSFTTAGNISFSEFNDVIKTVVDNGVRFFSLEMEQLTIIDDRVNCSEDFSLQRMVDFFVKAYPLLDKSGLDFVMKIYAPFCLFPSGFIEELKRQRRIVSGCHLHKGSGIIIDPAGKLLPCNHFCNNPLGELGRDFSSGEDYLSFRKRPDVIDFYKTISSYPHKKCYDCKDWQQCGAGCRLNWLTFDANKLIAH
jgi:radical SAM protein with 4Fe4S-binding SPASM domain